MREENLLVNESLHSSNEIGNDESLLPIPQIQWFASPWSSILNENEQIRHQQPYLLVLSEVDKASKMKFLIDYGVTMLGSGKGCSKPPDIPINGPGVAPQHCFIERVDTEDSILFHPISANILVNELKINEPLELISGDTIRIGSSNILQFIGTNSKNKEYGTKSSNTEHESQHLDSKLESNNWPSKSSEKNNSFHENISIDLQPTIMKTQGNNNNNLSLGRETYSEAECLNQNQEKISCDKYYENHSHAKKTEDSINKYRDNFESDNFTSKLARFEHLANKQGAKIQSPRVSDYNAKIRDTGPYNEGNGQLSFHSPKIQPKNILKTMSTTSLSSKPTIRRLNPYYSRGDEVNQFRYYSEDANSNPNYIIHSNEAVPIIGYKRTHSCSSSIKALNLGQIDMNIKLSQTQQNILEGEVSKPNGFQDSSPCSKSMTQLDQFSPSPDSMYSSHSSNSLALSIRESHSSENIYSTPRNCGNGFNETDNDIRVHSQTIHQNPERKHSQNELKTEDILNLDHILAICTEYQQQIAKEIQYDTIEIPKQTSKITEKHDNFSENIYKQSQQSNNSLLELEVNKESSPLGARRLSPDITSTSYKNGLLLGNYKTSTPISWEEEANKLSFNAIQDNFGPSKMEQEVHNIESTFDEMFHTPTSNSHQSNTTPELEFNCNNKDNLPLPSIAIGMEQDKKSGVPNNVSSKSGVNLEQHSTPNFQKFKHTVTFSPSASIEVYDPNELIPMPQINLSMKSNADITSRLKPPPINDETRLQIKEENISGANSQTSWVDIYSNQLQEQQQANSGSERGTITLKQEIRNLELHEMEALREIEIERALLIGEEKSLELEIDRQEKEIINIEKSLKQMDAYFIEFKKENCVSIAQIKMKLVNLEKELSELEKSHENFCGTMDEETFLLEKLKRHHEILETERKHYEDLEFHFMEEEINKETQRDELSKTLKEVKTKVSLQQSELEQLRNHNRISIGSSAKEILNLEMRRQTLLKEFKRCRESNGEVDTLNIPDNLDNSGFTSDSDDGKNKDLDQKLVTLSEFTMANDDAIRIQRIKSCSPIDPQLGVLGPKTSETLREIEKHREYLLNQQGVQMLEKERQRVRELQKRVQQAVKEEWEKHRSNCYSYNSTGSEDSAKTNSDSLTSDEIPMDNAFLGSINPAEEVLIQANGKDSNLAKNFSKCQQYLHKNIKHSGG